MRPKLYNECKWTFRTIRGNSAPALGEDDAGHRKYTGGALGRYITTGLADPPPDGDPSPTTTAPADDPELAGSWLWPARVG